MHQKHNQTMERRMTGNCHVRCEAGENPEITSKDYLSLFGEIPDFDKLIATVRSREISISIILKAKSQLKARYKDNADTIEGNCDTMLFLGGSEKSTLKDISESLGKETIDMYNNSITRGQQESFGMNYQKLGKELKSQDELQVMDNTQCILQVRGLRPFLSRKFDIEKHKNYPLLLDYDKKNFFDIARYVRKKQKRQAEISSNTEIDEYYAIESVAESQ